MNLIDWIETNRERLLDTKISTTQHLKSTYISGNDLLQYKEEIEKLDVFKDREVIFIPKPLFTIIENGYTRTTKCGDIDVQGKDGWTDEDKELKWLNIEINKDPENLIYLYGLRIYREANMFGMTYAITRPSEGYIKNKRRTKLIDKILC